jgi:hypothetical protein
MPAVITRLQHAQQRLKKLAEKYRTKEEKIVASMQSDLDLLVRSEAKPGGEET